MASSTPAGVDLHALTAWAASELPELTAPITGSLIAGGRSNITVHVVDAAGHEYVVRRPPLHSVLATAHDVGREHRVIHALGPTPVPVPRTLAMCTDESVLGAPFYVMEYVDGIVLNDTATALASLSERAARHTSGDSFVDALVALHDVDPDAVGLGDFAKRDEFIGRQLRRWHRQWEQTHHRDVTSVDRVHDILAARIPAQAESRIVHGDFRLGNCIVGDDGALRAVLDWELCTLGDPLADLGYVLATWARPDDERMSAPDFPTLAPGFVDRDELVERYASGSGRDVSEIDFYVAFSYWKLACILEGVYVRALAGAQGESDVDPDGFRMRVDNCAALAEEHATRLGPRA